ncbi:Gfo/Idh/MocA family protein [Candidatus Omnitrophota bacterium]
MRVAVIGCGYWGKNLVRNFAELGALAAIYDQDSSCIEAMQQKYGPIQTIDSFEACLVDKRFTAVVLAIPAEFHYSMVKEALLAGKDVFVEKPLALTIEEGTELVRLANEKQKILMVDHILQYHPAVIKLKELIDGGTLGKLQYVYSHRLNIGKLRREENILWSFAPHDISVILSLAGEFPLKVRAFGEAYLQQQVFDTTITDLSFRDRLRAHIFVSWLHPFKEQKLVIVGDKSMAVFDDLLVAESKLTLYPHKVEWVNRIPVASKAEGESVPIEKKEPLKEACKHFLECIQNRTSPKTDGKEALEVLKVLALAQKDLDRGE